MSILDRAKALFRASEGSHRGPFYGMGELGGLHQFDPLGDGWQRNITLDAAEMRHVPTVYACVMTIARAVSQCYPEHIKERDGIPEHVRTSAAYRVLRRPNEYSSGPEFMLNLIATALFEGEAFAVVSRNDRSEISSIHLLPKGTCSPMVDDQTKAIFYSVGASPLAPGGADFIAPAKDILHLKFHTPRHPLIGESPIKAAAMAAGINVALSKSQAAFFNQMNRPSGILSTDMALNKDQMLQLRMAFNEQSKSWNQGGMPILANGLKFQPVSISSQDAQLVQAQRSSIEEICRVFGVPPPLIGELSHATLNNSETLIGHFLSMSLGSYLETIERTFDRLFGLGINEYIELDTAALLRTNFEDRIRGLTTAVQGGLMTPSEARLKEGLPPVAGGDEVFLQRQMTSLNMLAALNEADLVARNQPEVPVPDDKPIEEPPAEKFADADVIKALVASTISTYRSKAS